MTVSAVRVVYVLPAPGFMDDLSEAKQIHVDWNTMVGVREMKRRKKMASLVIKSYERTKPQGIIHENANAMPLALHPDAS